MLDPADERYEAQRELSAAGVLSALAILVQVRLTVQNSGYIEPLPRTPSGCTPIPQGIPDT